MKVRDLYPVEEAALAALKVWWANPADPKAAETLRKAAGALFSRADKTPAEAQEAAGTSKDPTSPDLTEGPPQDDLGLVRWLLARPDRDLQEDFRQAAKRWGQELSCGVFLILSEKQRAWADRVAYDCMKSDIGAWEDTDLDEYDVFGHDIGDR